MNIQMKNKLYIVLIGLSLALSSCQDYEDVPVEKLTLEYVFSTTDSLGVNAKKYLNDVYSVLRYGHNAACGFYLFSNHYHRAVVQRAVFEEYIFD